MTLKPCPFCGTNVSQSNSPPYFGGIECPNQRCGAIFQFPTDLQSHQIISTYNSRQKQDTIMPVTTRFAIWATVASMVILGLSSIYGFIVDDIHTMLLSLK